MPRDRARRVSAQTGVPADILAAILDIESGGRDVQRGTSDRLIVRFEPHLFKRLTGASPPADGTNLAAFTAASKVDLAAAIRSASWGGWQVLGGHLLHLAGGDAERALAMTRGTRDELADVADRMAVRWWAASPRAVEAAQRRDLRAVALAYNGPRAIEWGYLDKLHARLPGQANA
ncbi:N-acetylmuramidase domain-containing protein [Myxococcota bacterium]|nr:N-acetylmuramidase domain-containing protein [Myxococcota bacterium]